MPDDQKIAALEIKLELFKRYINQMADALEAMAADTMKTDSQKLAEIVTGVPTLRQYTNDINPGE